MNEDKSFIPDILALLNDPSPSVWHAAPIAFSALTGKDLEIVTTSSAPQREQARRSGKRGGVRMGKNKLTRSPKFRNHFPIAVFDPPAFGSMGE